MWKIHTILKNGKMTLTLESEVYTIVKTERTQYTALLTLLGMLALWKTPKISVPNTILYVFHMKNTILRNPNYFQ